MRASQALLALSLGLGFWAVTAEAAAAEGLRIRVQRPLDDDALVDEAVNRLLGELSALGFEVEVLRRRSPRTESPQPPVLDPGTEGAIVFERDGDLLRVSAWVSNGEQEAFVETFDTADPRVTPEVMSVRAVEALRGVLIGPSGTVEGVPGAELTKPDAPPETAAGDPAAAMTAPPEDEHDEPPKPTDDEPASSSSRWLVLSSIAPAFGVESAGAGTFGIGGDVSVGRGHFSLALSFDTLLASGELAGDGGSARFGRQRVQAKLCGRAPLSRSLDAFAHLGAGFAAYSVDASADSGYQASDGERSGPFGSVTLGARYWVSPSFGVFTAAEASALAKPIRVRMEGTSAGTLGAPAVALSLGVSARVR